MFYLHTRAAALADAVTPGDIRRAVWAARFFHSMHVLPILLYYVVPFEEPLMFPCSLSFTQRKGYPYVAYHVLKLALGWPLLASVLVRRGGAYGLFWVAMVNVPGLCGSAFFTVETDLDKHKLAQLIELLVATQLMPYISMPRRYKAGVHGVKGHASRCQVMRFCDSPHCSSLCLCKRNGAKILRRAIKDSVE